MNYKLEPKTYTLTVGWLYPDLMSTYGDRGNMTVLKKRCELRSVNFQCVNINENTSLNQLKSIDFVFGGGAQDKEQEIVMRDLKGINGEILKELIETGKPALFVCGSPQLMGNYYEPAEGKRIEGLGIFDMVTVHPGPKDQRLIGNVIAEVLWENLNSHPERSEGSLSSSQKNKHIIGFENHGGRTRLGNNVKPFAKIIKGSGNNGEDGTEGVVYKNAIGSYLHGPLLPKNPGIADYLIQKSLEIKYKTKIELEPLDDLLEEKARSAIARRMEVEL